MSKPTVIWIIECFDLDKRQHIVADSHHQMVTLLLQRGFKRLLKEDVPYQDEPMAYEDKAGNYWDAMPANFRHASTLPHMDAAFIHRGGAE